MCLETKQQNVQRFLCKALENPTNRWGFSRRGKILFYRLPAQHTQLPFRTFFMQLVGQLR